MSEPIFFEWVEIEGFRGFQEAQRFQLDSSVILVTGPNGTGKTSFFDALQWLLVGSIERLEPWRVRRNAEHIVNQWRVGSGDVATVSAGIRVSNQRVEIHRSGRHDGSHLEWRDESRVLRDEEAEAALSSVLLPTDRGTLKRSLLRSGLLQQDVIRDVLEDKPAERYEQLAAILGLDAITSFPDAARSRASRLVAEANKARADFQSAEARLDGQRARLSALRNAAAESPNIAQAQAEIAARVEALSPSVRLSGELPVTLAEAQALRTQVARLGQALSTAFEAYDLEWDVTLLTPAPTAEELNASEKAVVDHEQAAKQASELATEVVARYEREREIAARFTRLAVEAMPLIGDQCPVCEQSIDSDHVLQHLQSLVDVDSIDLAGLQQERENAAAAMEAARRLADASTASHRVLAGRAHEAQRAKAQRNAWHAALATELPPEESAVQLTQVEQIAAGDLTALAATVDGLRALWRTVGDLSAMVGSDPSSTELANAEADVRAGETQLADLRERAVRASASEEEGRALQRAAVRAATSVTTRRFERLKPIIQDIYARLDPHPAFTDLVFAVDVYRERSIASPQVFDPESGVSADPLLIFSSAQANVVALSAFLALGWADREGAMPFLLLDDPLQSLDDVNALGFADLCRHIRTRRQLIVSTHDKRLAGLLERKLAPRRDGDRTVQMRFRAWSRTGPQIDIDEIAPQTTDAVWRALLAEAA